MFFVIVKDCYVNSKKNKVHKETVTNFLLKYYRMNVFHLIYHI